MPWQSKAQSRWGHSPTGEKALGGKDKVAEWDSATTPGSLPEKKKQPTGGALAKAALAMRKV